MKTLNVSLYCIMGLVATAPVFAQKDSLVANPTSPSLGAVQGGSIVQTTINYSVVVPENACKGNACTAYPRTVIFSVSNGSATIASGQPCALSNRQSSCAVTVNVPTPPPDLVQDKNYSITLSGEDSATGKAAIEVAPSDVIISFTVPKVAPALTKTKLTLDDACAVLRGNDVVLKARLTTEALSPLGGQMVQFSVAGISQSLSPVTNSEGVAEISVPVAGFGVGDLQIKAEFLGTSAYVASSDSAWLGIKYMFQGFMPPMNADGTSIFKTGRVIPFKIRLLDGQSLGGITNASPSIGMVKLAETTAGSDGETPIQMAPDAGYTMRYTNLVDDQYIYNWDLSALQNGSYKVMVDLNDSKACGGWRSTVYGALISVEKKK